eukprot:927123-Pyramimonas_sp.AAC.1
MLLLAAGGNDLDFCALAAPLPLRALSLGVLPKQFPMVDARGCWGMLGWYDVKRHSYLNLTVPLRSLTCIASYFLSLPHIRDRNMTVSLLEEAVPPRDSGPTGGHKFGLRLISLPPRKCAAAKP